MFTAMRYSLILTVTAMALVVTVGSNNVLAQGQTTGLRAQYIADYETM